MEMSIESLSGMTTRDKVVTAGDAVALIRDGDTIVVEGFAGHCFAEELTLALEARFLQTGSPRDLTLTFVVGQGDRQGRGFARLCYEGLLKRGIGGHWAMSPSPGATGRFRGRVFRAVDRVSFAVARAQRWGSSANPVAPSRNIAQVIAGHEDINVTTGLCGHG